MHDSHVLLAAAPIDGGPFRRSVRGRRTDLIAISYSHAEPRIVCPPRSHAPPGGRVGNPSGRIKKKMELLESVQPFDDCYTWWKSAPLRAGTNLESLSGPLQPGLRFLHHPIPAPPTASLAGCLPPSDLLKGWAEGRAYHVPCDTDAASNTATSRLGSVFPPVVQRRRIPTANGDSQPHTVWLRPTAAWAFHLSRGFSRQFTLRYPCGNHLVP